MKYKSGITTVSIVVYVILLFAFTTLALNVSSNISNGMFDDKGFAINLSNFDKTLYYLNKSAIESSKVIVTDNTLSFSNGDVFEYDSQKQTLYYNDGILVNNVTDFNINNDDINVYNIQIQLTSYSNELSRNIKLYIGE